MLEVRVLGGLEVVRDGLPATLPPSRRTRALLAYLALTRGRHRPEQLCEMFWDAPDDPSGSLRWSLSISPDPRNVPAAWAVIEEFTAEDYNPEGRTLYTYAAIQAFAQAAAKAKSIKLDDLSKALHSMTAQTVLGPLTWDKKGDVVNSKYVFYVWHNGTYAEM